MLDIAEFIDPINVGPYGIYYPYKCWTLRNSLILSLLDIAEFVLYIMEFINPLMLHITEFIIPINIGHYGSYKPYKCWTLLNLLTI